MSVDSVDPGSPDEIEIHLSAPTYVKHYIQLSVNGMMTQLDVGATCTLCYATVPDMHLNRHYDWHRGLAGAIANTADVTRTIANLTGES